VLIALTGYKFHLLAGAFNREHCEMQLPHLRVIVIDSDLWKHSHCASMSVHISHSSSLNIWKRETKLKLLNFTIVINISHELSF
jgi:hypothetical protein